MLFSGTAKAWAIAQRKEAAQGGVRGGTASSVNPCELAEAAPNQASSRLSKFETAFLPVRYRETNSKQEGRYGVVRATGDGRSWSYELKRAGSFLFFLFFLD